MGKTALAMNIVEHVALNDGKCVAVFSLEMSAEQLALRMLCSTAKVDIKKIRQGFMSKVEMNGLLQATTRISKSPHVWSSTEARASPMKAAPSRRQTAAVTRTLRPSARGRRAPGLQQAPSSAGRKPDGRTLRSMK